MSHVPRRHENAGHSIALSFLIGLVALSAAACSHDDAPTNTSAKGTEAASTNIASGKIWLRIQADIRTSSGGGQARFYYSTDGSQFTQLGGAFTLKKEWQFFLGYRYAIFNYATSSLGGSITVKSFQLNAP